MTKLAWTKLDPAPDPKHGKPCPRSSHGVSVLDGGKALILYGGENVARTPLGPDQRCWAVDGLDTPEPRWRLIDSAGSGAGPPARVGHAQAVASGGKQVYVFGGRAGVNMNEEAMDDLWALDCSSAGRESWTRIEAAEGDSSGSSGTPEARSFHRMVCIDDKLYVFGGCGSKSGRLADLHRFDLTTRAWTCLGKSDFLRGRGGPNLVPLDSGTKLGVVAGFAGEETNDGHRYDVSAGAWEPSLMDLEGLRPRSVCVSGSFPSLGVSVIFGGEVDPSERGHEGAGSFANDVVLLDEKTGSMKETVAPPPPHDGNEPPCWPESRGWSDAAAVDGGKVGRFYVFGGLSGDDKNPRRLDDLWRLDIEP